MEDGGGIRAFGDVDVVNTSLTFNSLILGRLWPHVRHVNVLQMTYLMMSYVSNSTTVVFMSKLLRSFQKPAFCHPPKISTNRTLVGDEVGRF